MTIQKNIKQTFGILAGLITYAITGKLGLYILQISWADYALHSIDKSYTLNMLLCRLSFGLLASVAAGIAVAKTVKNKMKALWFVGAIIFCCASYIHLIKVWADYPVWYHTAYLLPVIPVIILSGYAIRQKSI